MTHSPTQQGNSRQTVNSDKLSKALSTMSLEEVERAIKDADRAIQLAEKYNRLARTQKQVEEPRE